MPPQCHPNPFAWAPNCVRGQTGCETYLTAEQGRAGISIILDFAPYIGFAKGVLEACTGQDAITGEQLGNWRYMALLPIIGKWRGEGKLAGKWIIIVAEDLAREGNEGRKVVKAVQLVEKIAGTRGLEHSFSKHASEWFGRKVFDRDQALWQELVEQAAQSGEIFDWSLKGGAQTIAHLARIDGKYFVVQFFKSGEHAGELATAFRPGADQLSAMLRRLGK
jgi:hypothetical protein